MRQLTYLDSWKLLRTRQPLSDYKRKKNDLKRIYLPNGRYLSHKEAKTFYYLLIGNSAHQTAAILKLRHNTIIKYVDNVRKRLLARSVVELMEMLKQANFATKCINEGITDEPLPPES